MGTWRPANIKGLPPEAAGVINQLLRETNQRIDDLARKVPQHQLLRGSATLNFGSIPANSAVERTVNLLGVTQQGVFHASPILPPDSGNKLVWSARFGGPSQIIIRLANPTTGAITATTVKWQVSCIL